MTKRELIERIHEAPVVSKQVTKKAVGLVVDQLFAEISDYFIKAKATRTTETRFTYPGFGTFSRRKRNARSVRNPKTGAPIEIPAQVTVTFTPGSDFKTLLNRKPPNR